MKRLLIPAMAAALMLVSAPAFADPLPIPERVARPEEQLFLPKLRDAVAQLDSGSAESDLVGPFDALLAQLPAPTPLRGIVQYFRACALSRKEREAEVAPAFEESMKLLPGYSLPLALGARIYGYSDQPGRGVDYLLAASRIDPPAVNLFDDYEIQNLLTRLHEARDTQRAEALSERLIELGWARGNFRINSNMALTVLEGRMERGDVEGAATMVPKILSPESMARLLTDKKYAPLWPAVEAYAGPRLEKQWPTFLQLSRGQWEADHDTDYAQTYAAALKSAGYDAMLARTFLPSFGQPMKEGDDFRLIFVASPLAESLARLGRWDEAFTVLNNGLVFWPAGKTANALNFTANKGRLLFFKGDFIAAIKQLDAALEDARKWGSQVNDRALAAMHLYRACALEQLRRGEEAAASRTFVAGQKPAVPALLAFAHLCRNDLPAARDTLLTALEDEDSRSDVIDWIQPSQNETFDSPFARTMHARLTALKADRTLRAAVEKYGRILEEPINASAPPEAEFAGSAAR